MTQTITFETQAGPKMMAEAITESTRSMMGGRPSAKRRALAIAGWVVVFLTALTIFQVFDPQLTDTLAYVLMAGGLGVLAGLGIMVFAQRGLLRRMSEEAAQHGPSVTELSDTHITEHSEGQVLSMGLHRVRRVLRISDALVLRFSAFLFVIPDADLPDGMTPDAFRALLTDRITKAGGQL